MSNIGRRNSIVKRLWHSVRGRSDVEDLNNPYIIVSNFRETNEKECGKIDLGTKRNTMNYFARQLRLRKLLRIVDFQ